MSSGAGVVPAALLAFGGAVCGRGVVCDGAATKILTKEEEASHKGRKGMRTKGKRRRVRRARSTRLRSSSYGAAKPAIWARATARQSPPFGLELRRGKPAIWGRATARQAGDGAAGLRLQKEGITGALGSPAIIIVQGRNRFWTRKNSAGLVMVTVAVLLVVGTPTFSQTGFARLVVDRI